ncbi:glycosyltransferase [Pseudomonas laurylsulfatiphila]
MKIAHVVEAWAGGIATYVSNLIEYQLSAGHEVTLIADKDQLALDARSINVPVIYYKANRNPFFLYRSTREVKKILDKNTFDIVHAHSTFPGIYTRFLSGTDNKVVYTPHAWSFLKKDIGAITAFIYKKIESYLSFKSKKIICMSYEELVEAVSAGIFAEKIELIYTGIPDLVAGNSCKLSDLIRCDDKIHIGFFGRLDYQKGYDNLLQADQYLSDNVTLHIYGGAIRDNNSPSSIAPPLNRVVHHGWIPQSAINEEIRKMDMVIIPSRWEGFALAPLEAMRAGRGVIVSNMSSLPEVVIHGFNGLVLKDISGKEIARTLNAITKADSIKYADNARKVFEESFEIQAFMTKLNNCYHG